MAIGCHVCGELHPDTLTFCTFCQEKAIILRKGPNGKPYFYPRRFRIGGWPMCSKCYCRDLERRRKYGMPIKKTIAWEIRKAVSQMNLNNKEVLP